MVIKNSWSAHAWPFTGISRRKRYLQIHWTLLAKSLDLITNNFKFLTIILNIAEKIGRTGCYVNFEKCKFLSLSNQLVRFCMAINFNDRMWFRTLMMSQLPRSFLPGSVCLMPYQPNISMHIPHVPYTFPKVLARKISLTIQILSFCS